MSRSVLQYMVFLLLAGGAIVGRDDQAQAAHAHRAAAITRPHHVTLSARTAVSVSAAVPSFAAVQRPDGAPGCLMDGPNCGARRPPASLAYGRTELAGAPAAHKRGFVS